jgi:hypothetical protein
MRDADVSSDWLWGVVQRFGERVPWCRIALI